MSDSLPERNGVGAYYCDLMHLLEDEGYEATLLCPSEERPTIFQFPLPGDSTQRIWIPSFFRFRKVMKAVKPRAIIAATPGPYGLLGAWWSRRLGAKFIVGFHTHFSGVTDLYNSRFLRAVSRFYFNIADKILFRYGDLVLANSESMVELAESLAAKASHAIFSTKRHVNAVTDQMVGSMRAWSDADGLVTAFGDAEAAQARKRYLEARGAGKRG